MMLILFFVITVQRSSTRSILKILILIVTVVLLSFWTYERNSIWKNEVSLWTDIAKKAPNKARAQMNLGIILSKQGRMDEAMVYLNRAVQLDPDYDLAYYSLGDALMLQKKYILASESFAKALQIKPDNSLARFNLGKALAISGKHQNAVFHYRLTADKDPLISHQVYYFMGNSLFQLGRHDEAISAYSRALQLKPDFQEARKALINSRKIMEILKAKQSVDAP